MALDPRRVLAQIDLGDGLIRVSTIFLGLDHRFYGRGPPLLFETMTFGADPTARIHARTSTYAEAWQQHRAAVVAAMKLIAASEAIMTKALLAPR